jgi:hypothetical protein
MARASDSAFLFDISGLDRRVSIQGSFLSHFTEKPAFQFPARNSAGCCAMIRRIDTPQSGGNADVR